MILRLLVIVLVAANVAVFTLNFEAGVYSDRQRRPAVERARGVPALKLAPEERIAPERSAAFERARPRAEAGASTGERVAAALPTSASTESGTDTDRKAPAAGACFRFGPFSEAAEAAAFEQQFAEVADLARDEVEKVTRRRFWIYLEPAPPASVTRTLDELERLGVEDFFRIRDGSFENAVSLGVFSTRAAVDRRLAEIADKGYQPVVVPRTDRTTRWFVETTVAEPEAFQRVLEDAGDLPVSAPCDGAQ